MKPSSIISTFTANFSPMSNPEAIRKLVHNYCDRVCNNDQPAWLDLWTDDAVWDIGRGPVSGREAIAVAMATAMDLFESVIQLAFNGTASTDTETGEGRWYFSEFAKAKSGKTLFYLGYYDDTYTRTGGEWRFASRTLTWLYQGPSDLSGAFGPPAGYSK